MAVICASLCVAQALNLLAIPSEAIRVELSNILQVASALLSFSVCSVLFRRLKGVKNALSRPWGFIALSAAMFCVGQSSFMVFELLVTDKPYPGLPELFFFAQYPLLAIGLHLMPQSKLDGKDRYLRLLDIGVVTLISILAIWQLSIAELIRQLIQYPTSATLVSLAYTIADLAIVWLLFSNVLRPLSDGATFFPSLLIAGGALCLVCADVMQAYISLSSDFTSGGIQDLGWVMFSCLTALAALCQFDRLSDEPQLIPAFSLKEKSKSFYISVVTQLWIGAMILVMFAASSGSSQSNRVYLILGLALLFAIVVYRQIVNVKDLSLLHEQLRLANETLEIKVQERTKSLAESADRLRLSETTLKTLLNAIPEPAFLTDQTGIILAANAKLASYFGGDEKDVIGRDFIEIAPPDIKADRKQRFKQIIESRQPYYFEQYLDGLYYENRISPVLDADGNVVAMAIIAFEVTKRVLNEKKMALLLERLNLAAKAGRFGIWDWNVKDDVLVWDDLMFEIYGITREDFTGSYSDWLNTIVEEERQETDALMQKAVRGEEEYDTVFKIRWADGSIHYLRALGKLTCDEDGNPVRFTGVNFDITEQKHAELELLSARTELESRVEGRTKQLVALNRELEAFSYSVSHDLRAPLRAIIGFSQVLQEDYSNPMEDEAKEYLNRVVTAGQKMNSLVDALLMLSQVTRAKIKNTRVNLSASAEQIMRDLAHSEPGRQVEVNIEPGIEVVGDTKLLEILWTNLLQNAWKYTSKVDCARISVTSSNRDRKQVITVSDNGAGFDMKYADKLFDPFQRLHSSHDFSGTGVGLATVHRIIARHGGEIWAESEPGKGAAFHFTLRS